MLKISVASLNPVKINSTKEAFLNYFQELEMEAIPVNLPIPDQPFGEETFVGAEKRADYLFKYHTEFDYYVGIEGGLIEIYKHWFSFGAVCIVNNEGKKSFGTSILFPIPLKVIEEVRKGHELGEVIDTLEGKRDTKKQGGAISFLTNGILSREHIYKEAVISALIPFIKKNLF